MKITVAVIGSRDYPSPHLVDVWIDHLVKRYGTDFHVVSGACKGSPDKWGVVAAQCAGVPPERILEIPAQWRRPDGSVDKRAGFDRNGLVMEQADLVLAFWDGHSNGTCDTMSKAVTAGKPVLVIYPDGRCESWKPGQDIPAWWKKPA